MGGRIIDFLYLLVRSQYYLGPRGKGSASLRLMDVKAETEFHDKTVRIFIAPSSAKDSRNALLIDFDTTLLVLSLPRGHPLSNRASKWSR